MAAGKAWQPAQCMRPRPKLTAAAARGAIRSAMKPARTAPFSTCEQAQTGVIHSAGVHAGCRDTARRRMYRPAGPCKRHGFQCSVKASLTRVLSMARVETAMRMKPRVVACWLS